MNADLQTKGTEARALMVGHFIDGRVVVPQNSARAPVFNPALGKAVREVTLASSGDVDAAVRSAKAAQPAWAKMPALHRTSVR